MDVIGTMNPVEVLRTYAFLGLPAGLALGLALGLVARRDEGWGGYGSFRRRAARLGHVAAVMLPALAGLYALLLSASGFHAGPARWGAVLWTAGGILLPLALFAAAWRRSLVLALPLPATSLVAGGAAFALAAVAS